MSTRTIEVNALARVEGEGRLRLTIEADKVTQAQLSIFEPPRFFEALLKGRSLHDAPDITARICGICPVAYQTSACQAMERAAGVTVPGPLRNLRRLLYCGEWIASHTLHIYMLHAPDYLGYDDAIAMAKDHPGIVERGLRLKKTGNRILSLLGGREIHPINMRVGGFHSVPHRDALKALLPELEWARDAALETVAWTARLPCPEIERDYCFVSLYHGREYPIMEGWIVSNSGLRIDVKDYETYFTELHRPHSTALYSWLSGAGPYLVGPVARFNLNREHLTPLAAEAARKAGLAGGCLNPFKSIVVRSIEVLMTCEEAIRLIETYDEPDHPFVQAEPRATIGWGASEAPRGLLWHRYEIDGDGRIASARIVPPTSQNQAIIEEDLKQVAQRALDLPDDKLRWRCEQTVRNYDPCISCATHFLSLEIDRR